MCAGVDLRERDSASEMTWASWLNPRFNKIEHNGHSLHAHPQISDTCSRRTILCGQEFDAFSRARERNELGQLLVAKSW